jgi:phosphonate transport system substrate-binding protein
MTSVSGAIIPRENRVKKQILCLAIAMLLPLQALAKSNPGDSARDSLLLGVYEGVAGQNNFVGMQEKYMAFADFLSRTLQRRVKLESSQNLTNSLNNVKKGRYTLLFSKPSNVTALALRDHNYQLVAEAKGVFTVSFIVNANSPLKKPEDIRGKTIAIATGTFIASAGLAELRDRGLTPGAAQLMSTQFQDAVTFMVQKGFADLGMVSPPVAKEWQAKGGTVLFQSRKMPFWSLTASPVLSQEETQKLRSAMIGLESSDDGKKLLEKLGVKNFGLGNQQDYLDMLAWLEKK